TDELGNRCFEFDDLDRLTRESLPAVDCSDPARFATATYSYGTVSSSCENGIGRLCQVDEPRTGRTTKLSYDSFGRSHSEEVDLTVGGSATSYATSYGYTERG